MRFLRPFSVALWPSVLGKRELRVAGPAAFAHLSENLRARARDQREPLSVAVFRLEDLSELRSIFGEVAARQLLAKFCRILRKLDAPRGVIVRTRAAVFTVLLPGLHREAALAAVRQAFGDTLSVELDAGDAEIVVVPDFLVSTVPTEATSVLAWHDGMLRRLERSRAWEEQRQRYLRRKHESHSTRPAPLGEFAH
jgi:predicted signal transduction protein with EAL and GGDEF domain